MHLSTLSEFQLRCGYASFKIPSDSPLCGVEGQHQSFHAQVTGCMQTTLLLLAIFHHLRISCNVKTEGNLLRLPLLLPGHTKALWVFLRQSIFASRLSGRAGSWMSGVSRDSGRIEQLFELLSVFERRRKVLLGQPPLKIAVPQGFRVRLPIVQVFVSMKSTTALLKLVIPQDLLQSLV